MKHCQKKIRLTFCFIIVFGLSPTIGEACEMGHSTNKMSTPQAHSIEQHLKDWTVLIEKASNILLKETTRASRKVDRNNVKKGTLLTLQAHRILDDLKDQNQSPDLLTSSNDSTAGYKVKIAAAKKYTTLLNNRLGKLLTR